MSVLVGRQAPDFTSAAVMGGGEIVDALNFNKAREGKYSLVFFYPLRICNTIETNLMDLL